MEKLKVLILGSGGREVALAWKVSRSPLLERLWIAAPNSSIMRHCFADYTFLDINNSAEIKDFVNSNAIDLVVVGPEAPLKAGVSDNLAKAGIAVCGPLRAAAGLESSKYFTKYLCQKAGVLTAGFRFFTAMQDAFDYLDNGLEFPKVVKWNGLASGKGVIIAQSKDEAFEAVEQLFASFSFQEDSDGSDPYDRQGIIIEDYISGVEASFFVLTDGENIVPVGSAKDYKRLEDGNKGKNTGGMGSISPSPDVDDKIEAEVLSKIIRPILRQMSAMGIGYTGVLYAGLMINDLGVFLVEFNARFGDPECQALMLRMECDLLPLLMGSAGCSDFPLEKCEVSVSSGCSAVVVLASAGYPGTFDKGIEITGIDDVNTGSHHLDESILFYAGVADKGDGKAATNGGRVINVCASGNTVGEAVKKAYTSIGKVNFDGMTFRKDIGT